jgi:hypothetical protein
MPKEKLFLVRTEYHNKYVAVEGAVNDWACYVGSRSESDETVHKSGDKIREDKARELFPEFAKLHWRD